MTQCHKPSLVRGTTAAARSTAAAEAITAEPVATATETVSSTAEITWRREPVIPTTKRIEPIFAETVALVAAAPASPIVTHISECTLPHCPSSNVPVAWTVSRTAHICAGHGYRSALVRCS